MKSFVDLNAYELVRLVHLILLLLVILFLGRVLKRPFLRLFQWKYFSSQKTSKSNKEHKS